jgi:peptidoglycan/LPS O-acetylase OafA/YrhL
MTISAEKKLGNKDFAILDSIRGIASLYVAIAHCRGTLWMGGAAFTEMFPREGWSAWEYIVFGSSLLTRLAVEFVIVFFLLSGFSIAHSLAGSKKPFPFYKRRLVRIYPPYLAALVWAGIIFLATKAIFPQWYDGSYTEYSFIRTMQMNNYLEPGQVLRNLFYMPGNGFITPFWSLTYEVIFYLLAPFLLRKVHIYAVVSLFLFAAHWLVPSAIESLNLSLYIHDFLFVYNIYFAAGVMIYQYYTPILNLFKGLGRTLHLGLMILVLGAVYAVNFIMKTESEYSYMVAAVLAFLMIVYFLKFQVRIKWLMAVGKYSYTLYITHMASIFLYLALFWLISGHQQAFISNYFVWMGAVPFCLLLAYVQYLLVESKCKNILGRLRLAARPANSLEGK